jgi:hypothetical protein
VSIERSDVDRFVRYASNGGGMKPCVTAKQLLASPQHPVVTATWMVFIADDPSESQTTKLYR